jgi:hypothetical protein
MTRWERLHPLFGAACAFLVFAVTVAFVDQASGRVIP